MVNISESELSLAKADVEIIIKVRVNSERQLPFSNHICSNQRNNIDSDSYCLIFLLYDLITLSKLAEHEKITCILCLLKVF